MFQQLVGYALDAQSALPTVSAPISMFAGESGTLDGTILHADGTPYVLTNCTIQLIVWGPRGLPQPLISRDAAIVSSSNGTWTIPIYTGDTISQPGSYAWEIWLADNNFSPPRDFPIHGIGAWIVRSSNFAPGIAATIPPTVGDYVPANPSQWAFPPPQTEQQALARLLTVESLAWCDGGPIPINQSYTWAIPAPPLGGAGIANAIDRLATALFLDTDTPIPLLINFTFAPPSAVTVLDEVDRCASMIFQFVTDRNPIP
jgi:hypothetical protein